MQQYAKRPQVLRKVMTSLYDIDPHVKHMPKAYMEEVPLVRSVINGMRVKYEVKTVVHPTYIVITSLDPAEVSWSAVGMLPESLIFDKVYRWMVVNGKNGKMREFSYVKLGNRMKRPGSKEQAAQIETTLIRVDA